MNTNVQTKLIEILTSAQSVGADVYTVVQREAPELAREVVLSVGLESATYIVIWLIMTIASSYLFRRIYNKYKDMDAPPVMLTGMMFMLSAFICFVVTLKQMPTILKCIYTPRVVFMQEVGKLLK